MLWEYTWGGHAETGRDGFEGVVSSLRRRRSGKSEECVVRCTEMKRQRFGFFTKQLPPRLDVGSCGRSVTYIDGYAVCPSLGHVCPI